MVDDFAHHPTAVEKTLIALRQRYPGRRLVALFEPRSLTAGRRFFFEPYRQAFAGADRVLFAPTFHNGRLAAEERLDFGALAADADQADGVPADLCADNAELLRHALDEARDGSVLVTMSSGSFEGMPHRLLAALKALDAAAPPGSAAGPGSFSASRATPRTAAAGTRPTISVSTTRVPSAAASASTAASAPPDRRPPVVHQVHADLGEAAAGEGDPHRPHRRQPAPRLPDPPGDGAGDGRRRRWRARR